MRFDKLVSRSVHQFFPATKSKLEHILSFVSFYYRLRKLSNDRSCANQQSTAWITKTRTRRKKIIIMHIYRKQQLLKWIGKSCTSGVGVHTRERRKTNQKSFNNFNWREPILWQPNGETSAYLCCDCCQKNKTSTSKKKKKNNNRNCQSKHLNQTYSKPNKNSTVKQFELEPKWTRKKGKAKKQIWVFARQYSFDSLKSLKVIPKVPTATYRKGGKSVHRAAGSRTGAEGVRARRTWNK